MTLDATLLYGALLGLMTVGLAGNVSRNRGRVNALFGDGSDDGLRNAIRAHGNAAENVPLGLVLLAAVELAGGNSMSMHGLGGTLLLGRILSAHGILAGKGTRAAGAVLTWLAQAGLCVYALILHFR